jgi:hypothetical protein
MIAVVCPSNRPDSLERWRREWKAEFDRLDVRVYEVLDEPETWLEITHALGKNSAWIIPRQTDCIRSYGFWRAWRDGADYILTIDDDCYPDGRWLKHHVEWLETDEPRWKPTVTIKPRGMPENRGLRPTHINHGLWSHIPDLDAETQLASPPPYQYEGIRGWIGAGSYYPMSGMNLAFRREMVPAMYFMLMGTHLLYDVPWGYDRFGDIWAGVMSKKVCDHLGFAVRSGSPWVRHERASDPHINLIKEREPKAANEWLWERVDEVRLTQDSVARCYYELADKLVLPDSGYWRTLKRAMHVWAELFL